MTEDRGPELLGDVPPAPGFIPWTSPHAEICATCGALIPREWQTTHTSHHKENHDGLPTWPEDWRLQITSVVMQGWAVMPMLGPEGLAARLISMIEAWEAGNAGEDLPGIEQMMAELMQRGLVQEVKSSSPCPSLFLRVRDGSNELLACQSLAGHYNEDDKNFHWAHRAEGPRNNWDSSAEVPNPWPLDLEPPAGIDLLVDTGTVDADERKYLRRMSGGWTWTFTAEDEPNGATVKPWAYWIESPDNIGGNLVVVRP